MVFSLPRSMIVLLKTSTPSQPLDGKLKPITTQSPFLAPEPFARIYYEFNMTFAPHNLLFRDYLGLIFDPMSKYALTNV